jgi:hypothetical protein
MRTAKRFKNELDGPVNLLEEGMNVPAHGLQLTDNKSHLVSHLRLLHDSWITSYFRSRRKKFRSRRLRANYVSPGR